MSMCPHNRRFHSLALAACCWYVFSAGAAFAAPQTDPCVIAEGDLSGARTLEQSDAHTENSLKLLGIYAQSGTPVARSDVQQQLDLCALNAPEQPRRAKSLVASAYLCRALGVLLFQDSDPKSVSTTDLQNAHCSARRAVQVSKAATRRRGGAGDASVLMNGLEVQAQLAGLLRNKIGAQSDLGKRYLDESIASLTEAVGQASGDPTGRIRLARALGDAFLEKSDVRNAELQYNLLPAEERTDRLIALADRAGGAEQGRLLQAAQTSALRSIAANTALGLYQFKNSNSGNRERARQAFMTADAIGTQSPPSDASNQKYLAEARFHLSLIAAEQKNWASARAFADSANKAGGGSPMIGKQLCKTIIGEGGRDLSSDSGRSWCIGVAGPEGDFWLGVYNLRRAVLFAKFNNPPVEQCTTDGQLTPRGTSGSVNCEQKWRELLNSAQSSFERGEGQLTQLEPNGDFTQEQLRDHLRFGQKVAGYMLGYCKSPTPVAPRPSADFFSQFFTYSACRP